MTLNRVARWLTFSLAAAAAWIGLSAPAQAIPVFARQTGHNCQACHISYPELTAYGREFKLNGYTFGEAQPIPVAVALMGEVDHLNQGKDATTGVPTCTGSGGAGNAGNCNHLELVQYSIFYGGRLSENFGMFGQMSGGQFPVSNAGTFSPTADNTEFRYVYRVMSDGALQPDAVIGLNMNNNPTMQDVWNAVPAWRFPWFPYLPAGYGPSAAPYIDGNGGHNKVGIGVYAWIHKSWYAELNLYHSATGPLSFMNWGSGGTEQAMGDQPSDVLKGENPYYRLAYSHDWDYNSIEVGVFGMKAKSYFCNPAGNATNTPCAGSNNAANEYNDIAIDAQYQYNRNEPWVISAAGSYIHERNDLSAQFQATGGSNLMQANHTINELQLKATAYYNRMYGLTVGYSAITGTSDALQFAPGSGGSATGDPRSNWWTFELNYLPLQDLRFSLLYQAFTKINGGSGNFDGAGNNSTGQNRLTGAIWWVW